MIFGQEFTLTINGSFKGQQHVQVLNGQVTNIAGYSPGQVVLDYANNITTTYTQSLAKLWLDRMAATYTMKSVVCKSGVEEATLLAPSLPYAGIGQDPAGIFEALVGVACHINLIATSLPRKFARGIFVPLTTNTMYSTDGYLTTSGSVDMTVIAGGFVGWNSYATNSWKFSAKNSLTLQKGSVDSASYLNLITLMERRTPRHAP